MISDPFPTDPARRRVVVVMRPHDIERCRYEANAGDVLLDPEVRVVEFPLSWGDDLHPALVHILDADLARPGSILVQNPFDLDEYADASSAPEQFALAKHMHLSEFCMRLGAREVQVEQVVIETAAGRATLDVRTDTLKSSGTVDQEALTTLRSAMSMHDTFDGGSPDLASAEELLRRKHLLADAAMRSLLRMRSASNHLRTRELSINLSTEAKGNLNVAGHLTIPEFVDLAADYKRSIDRRTEYTLNATISF
jgi:hypothetical protein